MTQASKNQDRTNEIRSKKRIMELKKSHPGEWILVLDDGSYVHAGTLSAAYAQVSDITKIRVTLRPYNPQELLLY